MRVRVVGSGSFVPDRVVNNERIARAIPGWSAERISDRTGILERRFLWDIDEEAGRAIPPAAGAGPAGNADMVELALRRALDVAGLPPSRLDAIFVVTPTPDELNFCHDAMLVHDRLGCRGDCTALVVDSGCGGALYMVDLAYRMIRSGSVRTVAVVASTLVSAMVDRAVFTSDLADHGGDKRINGCLSMYMFGDGAGALVLRGDEGTDSGIVASAAGTERAELVIRRGGGARLPPHPGRASLADHAFYVDGPLVARAYPQYMQRTVDALLQPRPELVPELERYYLHQANKRVLLAFAEGARIPADRVPLNVERYGNTSAASTLILLAEDVSAGRVRLGSGMPVLLAACGAGVHYAGQLLRA